MGRIGEQPGTEVGEGREGGEVDKRREEKRASERESDLATGNNVNVAKSVTAVPPERASCGNARRRRYHKPCMHVS